MLMLLFTGGLQYPIPAALGGAVWIAGRVAYSKGYYTGGMLKENTFLSHLLIFFLNEKSFYIPHWFHYMCRSHEAHARFLWLSRTCHTFWLIKHVRSQTSWLGIKDL